MEYKNIVVDPIHGVWVANFEKIKEAIENGVVQLHSYQNRLDDDHNAKDSYLFDLRDEEIFRRCCNLYFSSALKLIDSYDIMGL